MFNSANLDFGYIVTDESMLFPSDGIRGSTIRDAVLEDQAAVPEEDEGLNIRMIPRGGAPYVANRPARNSQR